MRKKCFWGLGVIAFTGLAFATGKLLLLYIAEKTSKRIFFASLEPAKNISGASAKRIDVPTEARYAEYATAQEDFSFYLRDRRN